MNDISFEMPKNKSNSIKVIGVGGGGSNAVNHMYAHQIKGVDFIICNTDAQALDNSPIPNKIQLGADLTEGMGAGANPEIGARAAEESYDELRKLLDSNSKMVFITAGMGGGTGTGAAPVIARIARELDLLTVGIVTMPFEFEGKSRMDQAQKGIGELREQVDSLIVINNNKLREVYGNLGYKSGFSKADEVLATAARGIAEVITHHYKQNIDLNDAKAVLSNSGSAIMGSATAVGENRAQEAIVAALDSPLLNDNRITGAKNVLLLIVSGTLEVTIDEIGEINDHIRTQAGYDVNIILGIGDDESIGEAISITIIATGFSTGQQHEITDTEVVKKIHQLEDNHDLKFDFPEEEPTPKTAKPLDNEDSIKDVIVHTLEEETEMYAEEENLAGSNIDFIINEEKTNQNVLESEFELIPTTDIIKNVDIVYDEVLAEIDEDDFIINTFGSIEDDTQEVVKTNEQMELVFDFSINDDKIEDIELTKEIADIELIGDVEVKQDNPAITTHDLGDFEEEEETELSQESDYTDEELADEDAFKFELKTIVKKESEVKSKIVGKDNFISDEKITPLTASIEEFRRTTEARKMHLKKHNYTFHNNPSNIDEIEKEPAYKRQNVALTDNPSSADNSQSRTTIDADENDGVQLRSNNSFLHDNVD